MRDSCLSLCRDSPAWRLLPAAVIALLAIMLSPSSTLAQDGAGTEYSFTFERNSEGWAAGFADLPVDYDQSTYELDHGHRPLPDGLEGSGVYVQGHNRSDDLFMFLKRQVGGLRPEASYSVSISIDLATNVPPETFGIGGSPGDSVFVKAGASAIEPETVEDDNRYFRVNIDKGNQSNGGESMAVLGNLTHPEVAGSEYRIKTLHTADLSLSVNADGEGRLWLIVGTDSGFEGLSAIYYSRISYSLNAVRLPDTGGFAPPIWSVWLVAPLGAALVGLGALALRRRPKQQGRETHLAS